MENENSKKYWIAAAGALVVLGLVVWYFFPIGDQEMYNKSFSEGRDLFKSGDTRSVVRFEEAVKNAPTKADEALAKVNLGAAYLLSDPARGVSVLKEVANDDSYPAFYRAGAINYILQYLATNWDLAFAKQYVFEGDIWSGFYDEKAGTLNYPKELALRRAYEWSASLFSTFPAEYWIAAWYAGWATSGVPKDVQDDYVKIANERLAKGDAAYAAALQAGRTAPSQLGAGRSLRATTLGYLFHLGVYNDIKEIVTTYRQAVEFLEQDPADYQARGEALFARFYLASALLVQGGSQAAAEIRTTLAPMYKYEQAGIFTFLKNRADEKIYRDDAYRRLAIQLAKVDLKFRDLLLQLGWEASEIK